MGLKQHFVHGRGYAEVSVDLQRQILGGEQVVEHIVSDKPFDHFVRFAAFAEACPQAGSPCPCEGSPAVARCQSHFERTACGLCEQWRGFGIYGVAGEYGEQV